MKRSIFLIAVSIVCTAWFALCYSGCSPEVTIVGDKDRPIPINAEIKIHIYQHASSVVDDLQEGLDEEYEEEEDTSSGLVQSVLVCLVRAVSMPCAYAETQPTPSAEWNAAKDELKKVYRQSYPYLKKELLGENRDGYVSVINKTTGVSDEELKKASELAGELNKARKAFYLLDAKLQGVDVRFIQDTYARAFRDKANAIWVEERSDGEWKWVKK